MALVRGSELHSTKWNRWKNGASIAGVLVMSLVSLTGCGHSSAESQATQVLARVNDQEITVHQVDFQLMSAVEQGSKLDESNKERTRKEILEKLVSQQLIVQKAKAEKMDRDPAVVMALANARDTLLAKAYLDKISANIQPISQGQVEKYFADRPELFAHRRIYRGEQMSLDKTVSAEEINSHFKQSKTPKEFVEWLKTKSENLKATPFEAPAERLSMDVLPSLYKMKQGETRAIETPTSIVVAHLVAFKEMPVTLDQVKTSIAQFLVNQQRATLVNNEMDALRHSARVEILGVGNETKEKPEVKTAKNVETVNPPSTNTASDQSALEKGLAGLK